MNKSIQQGNRRNFSDEKKTFKASSPQWTFLSNHTHVLVCLHLSPDLRMRDIADLVGITERGVQKIVSELEEGGVIRRERRGRRNHYEVELDAPMRHRLESHASVGQLLAALAPPSEATR